MLNGLFSFNFFFHKSVHFNMETTIKYLVAFTKCPFITVSVIVAKEDKHQFESWLIEEQDNSVAHAVGGDIEY